jgi:hypothetical protein
LQDARIHEAALAFGGRNVLLYFHPSRPPYDPAPPLPRAAALPAREGGGAGRVGGNFWRKEDGAVRGDARVELKEARGGGGGGGGEGEEEEARAAGGAGLGRRRERGSVGVE